MASIAEIMQLCRLCLVKEQVNVPIFEEQGDIRQIFLKITACLPVKISREDNLPKKICNGCLYKLELLYQFWNTSTNAEKQLLSWLTAAGLDATTQTTQDAMAVVTQTQVVLKQEPNPEITENVTVVSDPGNFILQAAQQPIEFPAVDFDYQDNFTAEQELANNAISADVDDSTESEPVAKRPRRTATATVTAPLIESEDDADDPGEAAVAAKTEEDSDDDTNVEPTFVDVAEDQDGEQPGPSGLGKIVEPSIVIDDDSESHVDISKSEVTTRNQRKRRDSCARVDSSDYEYENESDDNEMIDSFVVINGAMADPNLVSESLVIDSSDDGSVNNNGNHFCDVTLLEDRTPTRRSVVLEKRQKNRTKTNNTQSSNSSKQYNTDKDISSHTANTTCGVCGKNFYYSREKLLEHQKMHKHTCTICGKTFRGSKQLEMHKPTHTDINFYKCRNCGVCFENIKSLKEHVQLKICT